MPWKRLFRWFVRIALVCLVLLLIVVAVVWNWVRADRGGWRSDPRERMIALALGWRVPNGGEAEVRERLHRQPELMFALLENDSFRVRDAAKSYLLTCTQDLNAATLDAVAAEMRDESGLDREFMVRFLAQAGKPGVQRLATLYRGPQEIDPALQRAICGEIGRGMWGPGLIPMLWEVVRDPSVQLENRCRAVEALSCLFKPERIEPDWMEELPESRATTIASLREMLPNLPDSVANAVKVALKRSEDEDAARQEMARIDPSDRALWPEITKGDARAALAALSDRVNWWKVGAAADALARNNVKEAIPALRSVSEAHWYSPVRKTAQRAIRVLEGQELYLPPHDEHGHFTAPFTVDMFREEELKKWRKNLGRQSGQTFAEELARLLEPARDACFWRFQPRVDQVEYRRPGRLPRRIAIGDLGMVPMHPKHTIRFADGTLLGYDEGEFGAGTVFYRKGAVPQFFATPNVHGFARMPFGMLVMTNAAMIGTAELYLATKAEDGTVTVAPFKRLPSGWDRNWHLPSGDLRIECEGGDVIIATTGEIRMAAD